MAGVTCDGRCYVGTVWRDEPGTLPCSVSQVIRSRFGQTSPSLPRHFRYVIGIQLLVTKNIFFLESLKKIFLKTDQIVHVQLEEVIQFQ